ncbi:MAG: ABC transporter substrate-binding protein, partial [Methylococcales bacterium]|nr:ABC transporter substrate-binding protein [Methylococcales bacterium]
GSTGTPTAKVAIPFTSERKKLLFGALTGAGLLRQDPPDRYVMNYRASYAEETAAMVHYFTEVKDIPANEIAVFSQNDSYGDSGFLGVEKTLRHSEGRAKVALHVRYERNSTHVQTAIDPLLSRPDIKAVVMVGTYKATSKFIKGVMDGGMKPLFASVSFVGSRPLAERLHEMGPEYAEGVVVTQVVPFYHSNATGVLKYRADLKQYYPQESPSFISLEGYVVAEILVEGIRRVSGEVTTESLISALESIKELDLGIGTILSFAPSRHQASDKVWGAILGRDGQYQSLDLE